MELIVFLIYLAENWTKFVFLKFKYNKFVKTHLFVFCSIIYCLLLLAVL
jgi:hypothetical protein